MLCDLRPGRIARSLGACPVLMACSQMLAWTFAWALKTYPGKGAHARGSVLDKQSRAVWHLEPVQFLTKLIVVSTIFLRFLTCYNIFLTPTNVFLINPYLHLLTQAESSDLSRTESLHFIYDMFWILEQFVSDKDLEDKNLFQDKYFIRKHFIQNEALDNFSRQFVKDDRWSPMPKQFVQDKHLEQRHFISGQGNIWIPTQAIRLRLVGRGHWAQVICPGQVLNAQENLPGRRKTLRTRVLTSALSRTRSEYPGNFSRTRTLHFVQDRYPINTQEIVQDEGLDNDSRQLSTFGQQLL